MDPQIYEFPDVLIDTRDLSDYNFRVDCFIGSPPDAADRIQSHLNSGWRLLSLATITVSDQPTSVAYFIK